MELAMEQLVGKVRDSVQHWVGDKMKSRKRRDMICLVKVSSTSERHQCVDGRTPRTYLR